MTFDPYQWSPQANRPGFTMPKNVAGYRFTTWKRPPRAHRNPNLAPGQVQTTIPRPYAVQASADHWMRHTMPDEVLGQVVDQQWNRLNGFRAGDGPPMRLRDELKGAFRAGWVALMVLAGVVLLILALHPTSGGT